MPVGNGFMFRARREEDANLFVQELQDRRRRRFTRRETYLAGAVLLLVGAVVGVATLIG